MGENIKGLTSAEAEALQAEYGRNELPEGERRGFFHKAIKTITEPMFVLLICAAVIYFILGEPRDASIMLVFVIVMIAIDVYQEYKTDRTLNALKDLSAPRVSVMRDGLWTQVASAELVPGDVIYISEGVKIPADGLILDCHDMRVDESSLTGEAEGVWKTPQGGTERQDIWRRDYCYAGTQVTQGSANVRVEKTGAQTEYGKIGEGLSAAKEPQTPLSQQTGSLVRLCASIAAALFVLVVIVTWFSIAGNDFWDRLVQSVLSGVTLSMAMIPEEFPVILTVFLSMGAWRLAKRNSLVRRLPSVETLGAVSVLCVDKTGTVTMNHMTVMEVCAADGDEAELLETMGLACETDAYDPMEQAMLSYCEEHGVNKSELFGGELLHEYPFTNEKKMMGHVWKRGGETVVAAKGSPERLIPLCDSALPEVGAANSRPYVLSAQGLRVIAVAKGTVTDGIVPGELSECKLRLVGFVGLADPPRPSVAGDISACAKAGIRVIMITGDSGPTAQSIARAVGIGNCESVITGDELSRMTDEALAQAVKTTGIFARVMPEHKTRIVMALQAGGYITAMTGDGVNDAPALKRADIGIAMGKRGSEVSREAADIILMDDNFSTIVATVRDGRRIYDNIRKAVGYVFTIHIPIALTSLLAPILGVAPPMLMILPLHVVILELIIDPTCSIVLERQPAEADIMNRPPRDPREKLIGAKALIKSLLQGLAIFIASFSSYMYTLSQSNDAPMARAMGLTTIMVSNIFLIYVNSSDSEYAFTSFIRLIHDRVMWAVCAVTIGGILLILYSPANEFLKLAPLSPARLLVVVLLASCAVLWYEVVKFVKRFIFKADDI